MGHEGRNGRARHPEAAERQRYFPEWLLSRRRRAEQALITVVATSYVQGVSTRRVEKLCEALGIDKLSKSQVSEMAKALDEVVAAFRNRPLDAGPFRFCWADALVVKVREQGRTQKLHVLVATGVNAEGYREILGLEVSSEESGAGWLAFFRGLVARGLSGVAPRSPRSCLTPPRIWTAPGTTCLPSRLSPGRCGASAGRTIPRSASTGRFVAERRRRHVPRPQRRRPPDRRRARRAARAAHAPGSPGGVA